MKLVLHIISFLLILLFAYTSINKLSNMHNFELTLKMTPHLYQYSSVIAYGIVVLELLAVFLLMFASQRLWGFWLSLVLMLSFTIYIIYMFLYSSSLPCSCGGIIQKLSWKQHLILNVLLSILAVLGIYLQNQTSNLYCNKTGQAENLNKRVGKLFN